jgi:hypothetical protein
MDGSPLSSEFWSWVRETWSWVWETHSKNPDIFALLAILIAALLAFIAASTAAWAALRQAKIAGLSQSLKMAVEWAGRGGISQRPYEGAHPESWANPPPFLGSLTNFATGPVVEGWRLCENSNQADLGELFVQVHAAAPGISLPIRAYKT